MSADSSRPELIAVWNPAPWCLGDDPDESALRALGAVLGDLASLGYDASWHGLRAADVGAPHGRFRVFIVAYPAGDTRRVGNGDGEASRHASRIGRERREAQLPGPLHEPAGDDPRTLLPTPRNSDANGAGAHGEGGVDLRTAVSSLLPTPAVNDMGEGKTPDAWDEWTTKMQAAHGNGNGHGKSLAIEAQRLLPTPTAMDSKSSGGGSRSDVTLTDATVRGKGRMDRPHDTQHWGDYAPAIARWEASLGRPAPAPTEPSPKGSPRLSPRFVEWMMGLPPSWVTDVPGLTRSPQLKALGNGVVPQQAEAALRLLLGSEVAA